MAGLTKNEIADNLRVLGIQVLDDLTSLVGELQKRIDERNSKPTDSITLETRAEPSGAGGGVEDSGTTAISPESESYNPFYDDSRIVPFDEAEKRYIATVLREAGWNVAKAANLSELGQATIYRKIRRYGIRLLRKKKDSDSTPSQS